MNRTTARIAISTLALASLLASCGEGRTGATPKTSPGATTVAVAPAGEDGIPLVIPAGNPDTPATGAGNTGAAEAAPTQAAPVETIDHNTTLGIMGIWSPITATHGNPMINGFPLSPGLYCYDALFDAQAFDEKQPFLPLLGESYSMDDATKTLTMRLKPGMVWHDGLPITAEDVKANLCMELNRSYVWDFISAVKTLDERTVSVSFLNYNLIILSKVLGITLKVRSIEYKEHLDRLYEIIEKDRLVDPVTGRWQITLEGGKKYVRFNGFLGRYKPDITRIPISGPFVFTVVTNDEVIMERNENYWNASQVHFKTLVQNKFTSVENAVLLTKAGKLDMDGTQVTPEITTQIERQFPRMRTLLKPVAVQYGLAFNFEKYPTSVPEVRKALSMAIDRSILFDIKKPLGRPADPYASSISKLAQDKGTYTDPAFMKTLTRYDYEPKRAAALLESIGWRKVNGKWADEKGEVVKFELNSSGIIIEAEVCRDLLADFGIDIDYIPVDGNVMWSNMEQGKHMIYYGVVGASIFEFPDPWSSFNSTYYYPLNRITNAYPREEGQPFAITDASGVVHDVGKAIADLRAADSDAKLRALTHEMAKLTNELCPQANLFEETEILRIYDPSIRLVLKGYDNKASLVTYDDYSEIRTGFAWSLRVGRLYKVK